MSKAQVMALRLHGGGDEYALTGEGSVGDDDDCPPKRRQVVDAATHQHQQQEHQEGDGGDDDDKLLARDLAALSVSEREEAMLNLHGIYESDQQVQETPELLQTSLAQLDNCLEKFMMSDNNNNNSNLTAADIDTSAYRKALIQNPEYVKDPGLRTCILRTEKFQVEEAAKRLFRFFNAKELIFGETLLTKNICLQDLSEDDRLTLQSGFLQFLPLRDSSGRAVLLGIPSLRGSWPLQSRVKIGLYMILSLMNDIETQRRGFVHIQMNIGKNGGTSSHEATTVMQKFSLLSGSLPIRADAYHVCFDEAAKKAYSTICTTKYWSRMRVRARLHMGNLEKLKLELMSFGICCNPEIFPILTENDVDLSHHRHWLQGQCQKDGYDIAEFFKQIESETVSMDSENTEGINTTDTQMDDSSEEMIELPTAYDILIGRSSTCQGHAGNVKYLNAIEQHLDRYNSAESRTEKTSICQDIVDQMLNSKSQQGLPCRFLTHAHQGAPFRVMTAKEAREKVSAAMRDKRKTIRRRGGTS